MLSNNIALYNNLKNKLFFTTEDISEVLGINFESSKVLSSRYAKKELLIRLKKNLYTLPQKWEFNNTKDFFKISNILQVPSYISLMTALSYYEITTQVQQNYFENICLKRSIQYNIKGTVFNFYKINKRLYSGFTRINGIFIATKEKALIDAVYLFSFGKYKMDFNSLDYNKLDKNKIKKILKDYPERTKNTLEAICRI